MLGVDLDKKLSWEKQTEKINTKPYVPPATLQTIYETLVQSYFDYCSPSWDNCGKELQDRQDSKITRPGLSLEPVRILDPHNVRRSRQKSILMYRILNDHTAPNLNDLSRKKNNVASQKTYNLRNSETNLALAKPKTRFLKRNFWFISDAILCNNLSQELKRAETISSFGRKIKQIYYSCRWVVL